MAAFSSQILHRQTGQMDPVTGGPRQCRPGAADLLEDLVGFGVVADRGGHRTRQQQMGAQLIGDVMGESLEHPQGVLQGIPA